MKPHQNVLVVSLTIVIVATAATAVAFNPMQWFGGAQPSPTAGAQAGPPSPAVTPRVSGVPESFAPIAQAAQPAVVNVSTTQTIRAPGGPQLGPSPGPFGEQDPFSEFFRHFFPQIPRSFTQRALGSGFIIDGDGDIVTNAHVVKGAEKVVVKLQDGREFDAKVVGIDEKTDVALLKIQSPGNLHVAVLGDSDTLQVGDWVVAIGNPFGLMETVTAGIVSAKGRVIGAGPYDDFIQTDASINPGNSGGPLLNVQAQVIGINSAIFSQSGGNIGIGFAIPINLVRNVVEQLKAHGKVVRGWLGVSIQDVTPDLAKSFGLKETAGGLVADVTPDSPAARTGIQRGDIVIEYNGTTITEAHQLPGLVAETKVGATVPITVLRNGSPIKLSITVAEMPGGKAEMAGSQPTGANWGLQVSDVTQDLAQQFNLETTEGVVVTAVAPDSPAQDAGLRPGDVISQVNRQPVHNTAEYERVLSGGNDQRLLLLVHREGQSSFVVLNRSK